jgi:methylglutamate dehydrogenase subunit D
MLEARSPLSNVQPFARPGLALAEAPGFTLTQVAGAEPVFKKQLGKVPTQVGVVLTRGERSFLRVGPHQLWVLGEAPVAAQDFHITPLSSGRTRFLLEGARARDVLSACAAIDFSADVFGAGQFVMTGIHHTPVTIHCLRHDSFHIYTLRSFAVNVWDWLCDVGEGLGRDDA